MLRYQQSNKKFSTNIHSHPEVIPPGKIDRNHAHRKYTIMDNLIIFK